MSIARYVPPETQAHTDRRIKESMSRKPHHTFQHSLAPSRRIAMCPQCRSITSVSQTHQMLLVTHHATLEPLACYVLKSSCLCRVAKEEAEVPSATSINLTAYHRLACARKDQDPRIPRIDACEATTGCFTFSCPGKSLTIPVCCDSAFANSFCCHNKSPQQVCSLKNL